MNLRINIRRGASIVVELHELVGDMMPDDMRHLASLLWSVANVAEQAKRLFAPPTEAPAAPAAVVDAPAVRPPFDLPDPGPAPRLEEPRAERPRAERPPVDRPTDLRSEEPPQYRRKP